MATKCFEIEEYKIALGHELQATWSGVVIKARGYLACFGEEHRLLIYGLTENSPVPSPQYVPDNRVGLLFVPFAQLAAFIDLVRNEEPVYAYLNSDHPEWNSVKTSREPVGEEEA